MKQYEVRSVDDLLSTFIPHQNNWDDARAIAWYRVAPMGGSGTQLVLHEFESLDEANRARVMWMCRHSFYTPPSWGYHSNHHTVHVGFPPLSGDKEVSKDFLTALDQVRGAPVERITLIQKSFHDQTLRR